MMKMDTRHISYNGKIYCAYCGKEIKPDCDYDHYDVDTYWHCDCDDALKEIEIAEDISKLKVEITLLTKDLNNRISELVKSRPKVKYEVRTMITKIDDTEV